MLRINSSTTFWCPKPHIAVDARDIASIEITAHNVITMGDTREYTMQIGFSGKEGTLTLGYKTIEELNTVLSVLGLSWEDTEVFS